MTIHSFPGKHRRDQIDPLVADEVKEQIDAFERLPKWTRWALQKVLDQHTAEPCKWTFIMLSPQQNAAVVRWLRNHSKRRVEATSLWSELFTAMRMDTGEIMMTRDELAELVGCSGQNVSQIMSELASINAISRRRERIPGVRGPGRVRYFMNPNVATTIAGAKNRRNAQENAGQLNIFQLIDGGKPEDE